MFPVFSYDLEYNSSSTNNNNTSNSNSSSSTKQEEEFEQMTTDINNIGDLDLSFFGSQPTDNSNYNYEQEPFTFAEQPFFITDPYAFLSTNDPLPLDPLFNNNNNNNNNSSSNAEVSNFQQEQQQPQQLQQPTNMSLNMPSNRVSTFKDVMQQPITNTTQVATIAETQLPAQASINNVKQIKPKQKSPMQLAREKKFGSALTDLAIDGLPIILDRDELLKMDSIKFQAHRDAVFATYKNLSSDVKKELQRQKRLVKNRESAAASRNRKRERIEELEHQVRLIEAERDAAITKAELAEKEKAALQQKIKGLESKAANNSNANANNEKALNEKIRTIGKLVLLLLFSLSLIFNARTNGEGYSTAPINCLRLLAPCETQSMGDDNGVTNNDLMHSEARSDLSTSPIQTVDKFTPALPVPRSSSLPAVAPTSDSVVGRKRKIDQVESFVATGPEDVVMDSNDEFRYQRPGSPLENTNTNDNNNNNNNNNNSNQDNRVTNFQTIISMLVRCSQLLLTSYNGSSNTLDSNVPCIDCPQ